MTYHGDQWGMHDATCSTLFRIVGLPTSKACCIRHTGTVLVPMNTLPAVLNALYCNAVRFCAISCPQRYDKSGSEASIVPGTAVLMQVLPI